MQFKDTDFASLVVKWFDQSGRKKLPWKNADIAQQAKPYHIWLSEIMLQQTQVATVIPYYLRFIDAFPELDSLAKATQDEVLSLWSGLGYYARARNLHKAAQNMWFEYRKVPADFEILLSQPGIGRSTAGAIMAQAFEQSYPILDGNVKRVLTRFHAIEGWPGQSAINKQLWVLAERYTPDQRVADYTQAIMDLGALVCTRRKPSCSICPLAEQCVSYKSGRQHELPTAKPRKTKPRKSVHVLCLIEQTQNGKRVLLEQRPPVGIWGGLWSLPEFDSLQALDKMLEQNYGKNESDLQTQDLIAHAFSHYHLDIQPHILRISSRIPLSRVADSERFFDMSECLNAGLPAPIRKFLQPLSK